MKRIAFQVMVLAVIFACVGCGAKVGKDVAARVNGKDITLAMLDEKIKNMPVSYQEFAAQHKNEVVNEMVIEELLYEEAKKRKLDEDNDVKELINEAIKKVLISKLVDNELKKSLPVSEDDVAAFYEEHKDQFIVPEMVRASHILVGSEEIANQVKDELQAGQDFSEMAAAYSKDLTKDRGGDLGYFGRGQMIPEFEKVCFSLNVGDVSGVVKTRFGYHIIKVTDRRQSTYQQFDDIKENIRQTIERARQKERFDEVTTDLKSSADIFINEEAVAPEPVAADVDSSME
ncbi:MAG: peptidylprolyl isomerase [Candidatus Omnitrophota bacterium]